MTKSKVEVAEDKPVSDWIITFTHAGEVITKKIHAKSEDQALDWAQRQLNQWAWSTTRAKVEVQPA